VVEERAAARIRGLRGLLAGCRRVESGTWLALGWAAAACVVVVSVLVATGVHARVPVAQFVVLAALAFVASRIQFLEFPVTRGEYSPAGVVIVVAALLGGPVVGAVAGAAGAHRYGRAWQANLLWLSVPVTAGSVAGLIGLSDHAVGLRGGVAMTAYNAIVFAAVVGVQWARHFAPSERMMVARAKIVAAEILVAFPLIVLVVDQHASNPLLAMLGLGSLLAVLAFVKRGRLHYQALITVERQQARRDSTTGLPNRRAFEEAAAQEHARVLRGGTPAGMLLVDLDRFHWINQRHDYAGGDQVLREVGERLTAELRAGDLVARWGGEEFVILAPDLNPAALGVLAEKVRRIVRDRPVPVGDQEVAVTCSVGGAMLDRDSSTEAVFLRANRSLKRAKETRDAVVVDQAHTERRSDGLETETDSLTGMLNRQAFTRLVLPREIERSLATHSPLALLFVDLDDMKAINDVFGHQVGDQVIVGVADTLATVVGRDDLVFRIGGDEFAALLPLQEDDAHVLADAILLAISRRAFASEQQLPPQIVRVRATIGLSTLDQIEHAHGDPAMIGQLLLTSADGHVMQQKARQSDPLAPVANGGSRPSLRPS
jgi:diguanylate cyclase (GGDEF)-like protein